MLDPARIATPHVSLEMIEALFFFLKPITLHSHHILHQKEVAQEAFNASAKKVRIFPAADVEVEHYNKTMTSIPFLRDIKTIKNCICSY